MPEHGPGDNPDDVQRLTSVGSDRALAARRDDLAPPERRRPRRSDLVTYRVRVDLTGAKPPIWRRLELTSEMGLDELHQVIQSVFGWADSHLHMFALGTSVWDKRAQRFLCPFDVDEGEDEHGIPEQDVRLDEVLVEVGDQLQYAYDYGDGWEHVVQLEAVLDRPADSARAWCTDGRRMGPPEDCGGVGGYEELLATGEVGEEPLDIDLVNASLSMAVELAGASAALSGYPGALLRQLHGVLAQHEVAELVRDARLTEAAVVDAGDAARMLARFSWLLERVGEAGITLTSAGYLPPADVEAAWRELDLGDEWYGKGNRESNTLPLLELRESAQRLGLLRKYRGRLVLTKAGQRLRRDPVALWWHGASHLVPRDETSAEAPAAIVTLVAVAAGRDVASGEFDQLVAEVLTALGWQRRDHEPLSTWDGHEAGRETRQMLRQLGVFGEHGWRLSRQVPTPEGRALAGAALRGG
ncbi:MAG: plasmid pRiA4b ORF-3 family protein [Actinomycetes bacterium]